MLLLRFVDVLSRRLASAAAFRECMMLRQKATLEGICCLLPIWEVIFASCKVHFKILVQRQGRLQRNRRVCDVVLFSK